MLCERCGKNEANVHITRNINGRVSQMNLCSKCAHESGDITSFDNMFRDFFSSVLPARARRVPSFRQEALSRYAGCEDCLEDSRPDLSIKEKNTDEEKIAALKKQLKEAIEKEEYEKAAELRDQIRDIGNTQKNV